MMKCSLQRHMLVLALCITGMPSFAQGNTPVCHLGEIKNDSLLPYVQSLEISCNTSDAQLYTKKRTQLTALKHLILKGDTDGDTWQAILQSIRLQPQIEEVAFADDSITELPYGYDNLVSVPHLSFYNNETIDYNELLNQLQTLPNLQHLTLDIITVFDLPNSLAALKNIQQVDLINTDENISKNDTSLFAAAKEPVTFDYFIDKGKKNYAVLKYTTMAGEIDSDEYRELSKRFKTTFDLGMENTAAFTPKYKYVNPPIAGIDVERTQYKLNPTIDNVIMYPTGTKIFIPANAFSDKDGKPVTTPVTLSYREFRDPVDFLVSGIPMKYDTAGEVGNFESAGMFELTASLKNEPLKLNSGKKIDMNFASTSKDSTYNFYAFNDSTGNWQYLNKPQTVTAASRIVLPATTMAYRQYQQLKGSNMLLYDSTTLEQRFSSKQHVYTSRRDTSINQRFIYRKEGRERWKPMSALVRVSNVKRTKDGNVLFRIGYLPDAHPEMNAFSDVYVASGENLSAAAFREKYQRKKRYSDVRIYPKGSDVDVVLKDARSNNHIAATLVTIDKKGKVQDAKDAGSRIKRYQRSLRNRDRSFDKRLAKGKMENNSVLLSDPELKSKRAYEQVKKVMTDAEQQMSYEGWKAYCNQVAANEEAIRKLNNSEQQKIIDAQDATAGNLTQSLQLDGFGIYNCDQIQRMEEPVKIFARYQSSKEQSKGLDIRSTYIIDRHSNSVYQYDGYMGYSADKIAFSRSAKAENTLLAIDGKGGISIYTAADFAGKEFKNKSHFDFVVTKINSNFTTVSDLKKIIGF